MGWFKNLLKSGKSKVFVAGAHSFSYQNGSLATNETIFSAVTMLSNAVASAPVAVRKDYEKVAPARHPVARLCEYGFNPRMTAFKFIQCMEVLRNTSGAAYALKQYGSQGRAEALWLLRTECVTPVIERESRELYYRVRDEEGEAYVYGADMIAVSHISPDGVTPVSPIRVLQNSLCYDREVKEFSIDQMRNGLRANVVVKVSGHLSQEQFEEYNEMIRRFQKSGVLYLDNGKEISALNSGNIIDPRVFEVENITIARVARVYNIPLEKFLPDKTSYSSAEQSDLNYLRDTVLPLARMYEQEFTGKLLSEQERDGGMRIKFSLNGFARADMKTRGDFYFKGIRSAWFCPKVRALEDLPPAPLGDVFYLSRDLTPVQSLSEGGAEPQNKDASHETDSGEPSKTTEKGWRGR